MVKYLQYAKQNKGYVLLAIAILGFAVWLYYKGKKAGQTHIPDAKYPNGGKTIPSNWNPNILAEDLFRTMDGIFNSTLAKEDAWKKLYNLPNDEMKIAVYNAFNTKYASKGDGSLTKWIDDEVSYDYLVTVKFKLLDKLRSLNLK